VDRVSWRAIWQAVGPLVEWTIDRKANRQPEQAAEIRKAVFAGPSCALPNLIDDLNRDRRHDIQIRG
jgi:hypothetical protein